MGLELERSAVRVGQCVALALDCVAAILAPHAFASVVFMLWLSITAAVGLASRPTRSRSRMIRA